jgi:hypothetical protein
VVNLQMQGVRFTYRINRKWLIKSGLTGETVAGRAVGNPVLENKSNDHPFGRGIRQQE